MCRSRGQTLGRRDRLFIRRMRWCLTRRRRRWRRWRRIWLGSIDCVSWIWQCLFQRLCVLIHDGWVPPSIILSHPNSNTPFPIILPPITQENSIPIRNPSLPPLFQQKMVLTAFYYYYRMTSPPQCPIHLSPPQPLTSICLFKSCPHYFHLCCTRCKNETHTSHAVRVISLTEFYKNVNLVRCDLNKKLKIKYLDNEYEEIMKRLKYIRRFRMQVGKMESQLLVSAMELEKQHKEDILGQSNLISTLEFLNLNRNSEEGLTKIKEISGVIQYNFAKMRLEVSDSKGKRLRQGKQKVLRDIQRHKEEIKEYMVKILDVVLWEGKRDKDQEYSVDEFRGYITSSIITLEEEVKQSSRQMRYLEGKLGKIAEYLENPLDVQEEEQMLKSCQEAVREEPGCQQSFSAMSQKMAEERNSVSMVHYEPSVEDDRSVTCSIDFSRYEFECRGKTKERMMLDKRRIKVLEEENVKLRREKGCLEVELIGTSNTLSTLIKEIDRESSERQGEPSHSEQEKQNRQGNKNNGNRAIKNKLRIRSLDPIEIQPTLNEYKGKYQEILGLYNEVVSEFIVIKGNNFQFSRASATWEEENRRLKKKCIQSERQGNLLKREIEELGKSLNKQLSERRGKEQQFQREMERLRQETDLTDKLKSQIQNNLSQQLSTTTSHQSTITTLKQQNLSLSTRIQQLQSQIHLLESSAQSSKNELSQYQSLLEMLQRQKKQLSEHSQILRTQSLGEIERIRGFERQQQKQRQEMDSTVLKMEQLRQDNLSLDNMVRELAGKLKEQQEQYIQEKQNIERVLFQSLSSKSDGRLETENQGLKRGILEKESQITSLNQLIQDKEKEERDMRGKYNTRIQELELNKSEQTMRCRLLQTQNKEMGTKLNQYIHQLSLAKEQSIQKSCKLSQLSTRISHYQQENQNKDRFRCQPLMAQSKRLQSELNEERGKNKGLSLYIADLEQRIGEVEHKISDKSRHSSRGDEFERMISNLERNVNVLEGRLKDKELIERIYIKELDTKKQEIMKLNKENECLRGLPTLKKDVMKGVREKENKNLRKFLSFGEH